jgi:hypothetical protein
MGELIQFKISDKILLKQIKRDAINELLFLYKITAGFVDPCPPDEEMRRMFEEGIIEL